MNIKYNFNYQQTIKTIYDDARWEAYYDMVIIPLFNMKCKDRGVKIVPVHATRKSGRKPAVEKPHFIETYSVEKEVLVNKEKKKKRFGIPDFVIVPEDSTYENPKPALVNIEFKLPDGLTKEYIEVMPKKYKAELLHQFECFDKHQIDKNIILTDGITWYFLESEEDIENATPIKLYDDMNKCCESNDEEYSDTEQKLLNRIDELLDKISSQE